ncbi:hypothetical protein AS28_12632, partial [Pygoscelis adeliae]
SAGMLQAWSFSWCLQKGSQTASRRRGRETRTSILRFKMQIPPLSFRWRGQGFPISSSPPPPRHSFPEFCLGRDCRCDKVFVLAIQLNEKAEESQRREQTFGGQRGQLRINVSYCLY